MTRGKYLKHNVRSWTRLHASSVGLVIIFLAVLAMLLLQALTINKLQEQVAHQSDLLNELKGVAQRIDKNAQDRSEQIKGIDKHLDCIVRFFAQPDRTNKAIKDIDNCRIGTAQSTQPQSTPIRQQQSSSAPKPSSSRSKSQGRTKAPQSKSEEPAEQPTSVLDWLRGLLP